MSSRDSAEPPARRSEPASGTGGGVPAFSPAPDLSGRQLEAVIQRAAELQLRRPEASDQLTDEEVVRIADEVGLEERYVRQALAEIRANALVPSRPSDRSLAVRAWGWAYVQLTRVVSGDPAHVLSQIETYLEAHATLRQIRDQRERQVWEPASDLLSKLQRGLDLGGRGYELAKARRVEVRAEPLESGRTLVTVTADLSNQRTEHATGWAIGTGVTGAFVAVPLTVGVGFPPLLVIPAVLVAAGAAQSFATRRTFRRQLEKVELVIEGLLDRLERGQDLSVERRKTLGQRIGGFFEEA